MDNPIFRKVEKIFAYFFCAMILLFIVLSIVDVIQFINYHPDDYPENMDWKISQIIQRFLIILASILIFGLSLWRLIRPNKVLRLIVDFLCLIVIALLFIAFYYRCLK